MSRLTAAQASAKSAKNRSAHKRGSFIPKEAIARIQGAVRKPKQGKYRAIRTVVDGISFASRKEATVYANLKLWEKAGEIADLKLQPVIHCDLNGVHICDYRADFLFFDKLDKKMVWLDCKGFRTPVYKLKKKLVLALTGIEITEI